jgi:serine/threonine-protein kinase
MRVGPPRGLTTDKMPPATSILSARPRRPRELARDAPPRPSSPTLIVRQPAVAFTCAANLAEVHAAPDLRASLIRWGLALTVGTGTGMAVLAAWRWLRAPRIVRVVNAPVAVGGAAVALLSAAAAAHALAQPVPVIDAPTRVIWLAQCTIIVLIAGGVAATALRTRRRASQIAAQVLAATPDAVTQQHSLAGSIDDPGLALVFPRDDGTVIDAAGQAVGAAGEATPAGLAVATVRRASRTVAEVRYRAELAGAEQLLGTAVRSAGLALEHVAAQARLRPHRRRAHDRPAYARQPQPGAVVHRGNGLVGPFGHCGGHRLPASGLYRPHGRAAGRRPGHPGHGGRRRGHAADPDRGRCSRRRASRGDPGTRQGPDSRGQRLRHRGNNRGPDDDYRGVPVRVVIAEDMALLRQGLSRLLTDAGFDVVGGAGDADELLEIVARTEPDAALIDIKMPPTHTDEGLRAAAVIRERHPKTAVLLLSSYLEARYAEALLKDHPAGSGYLLKDRVYDAAAVGDALRRVSIGECVIDPEIISQLLRRGRERNPLDALTDREREILSLMAQGYSNDSICNQLFISRRTVESHVSSVFAKLGIVESPESSRRVLAVLAYLQG